MSQEMKQGRCGGGGGGKAEVTRTYGDQEVMKMVVDHQRVGERES